MIAIREVEKSNMHNTWPSSVLYTALTPVLGVTAVGLCLSLGYSAWQDYRLLQLEPRLQAQSENPRTNHPHSLSVQDLAALHLMGQATANEKTPTAPADDLPETRLQLVLLGTFTSTAQHQASALVSKKGQPAQRYSIDDRLPGGATLVAVHADRIILSRNGRRETLLYPRPQSSQTNPNNNSFAARTPRRPTATKTEPSRAESIKQRLERLRKTKQNQ